MTGVDKKDLIALRDTAADPTVKHTLRWAVSRIDELERKLRDILVFTRSIERECKDD